MRLSGGKRMSSGLALIAMTLVASVASAAEITRDGRAIIDLWCRSGEGRVKLEDDMIEFTLGPMREEGCTPERTQRDEGMAEALAKVANWRMEDDVLVLIGPTELRYTLSSH